MKWFQITATGIFIFFMSLLGAATVIAYTRHSGYTGLDMGKIQEMRYKEMLKQEGERRFLKNDEF